MSRLEIQDDVPLAPLTTLRLGGSARYYVRATSEETLTDALRWAQKESVPVEILAGGSNVVVSDDGFPGLVIHVALDGCTLNKDGSVRVSAGEPWDEVVTKTVDAGLAGFECLSGIPGSTGATPIQNVGAYGQEVSETVRMVRVLTRDRLELVEFTPADCEFGYRDSLFKRRPDRWIVLEVVFQLRPGGAASCQYPELAKMTGDKPSLVVVRDAVLNLRKGKSMVIDPSDPNSRSVGSFFLNPVVSDPEADRIVEIAVDEGMVSTANEVPRYRAGPGLSKLAAAWLIERSGFAKGFRRGPVGISSNHALALVHHGGGSTAELLALAGEIRDGVRRRFGVALKQEPRLLAQPSALA